jgi:hypothetical protein
MIDVLTKVLVGLYEEPTRPGNAVEYLKRCAVLATCATSSAAVHSIRRRGCYMDPALEWRGALQL